MDLTDDELSELHTVVYDYAYYGADEIVYTSKGDLIREVLEKIDIEVKRRKLW